MAEKREASPSNESAPKKQRRTKKVFVPPPGWEETPGWTTKPIHTSRCDMGQCGRHVTDDNPAKQCKCGLNVCWICEQARGGLHRGLWHDCVHYRAAAQDFPAPAPQALMQPSQPPVSQTPVPVVSQHDQVANVSLGQPNYAHNTTARVSRSGSAPPTLGQDMYLDKIIGQVQVNNLQPFQTNESQKVTPTHVVTFRGVPAATATPQVAITQSSTEMPGQPTTGQGSTSHGAWLAVVNHPEANPTQPTTAAAGPPPSVASSNIGQSPSLPPQPGYKEPIVRMRELTLLFRRPVAVSLRPLPHRHVHAAENGQALIQLMLSPSVQDVAAFEDIATSLATSPHELDGLGCFILRCLGRGEVSGGVEADFGDGAERCIQGLSSEIPEAYQMAASRLKGFTERWSPIELMDSLLERVRAIRSHL